jgi:uncharacterized protein YprB with RNaseH-like and TPR domain
MSVSGRSAVLSKSVLAKLSQLNRSSGVAARTSSETLSPPASSKTASSKTASSKTVRTTQSPRKSSRLVIDLESAKVQQNVYGEHLVVSTPTHLLWPDQSRYLRAIRQRWSPVGGPELHADLSALATSFPRSAVYLDLETCGFAGAMIFLIGLLHVHDNQLVLTQLFARNYAEEKSILQAMWQIVGENDVLVTFNGKSFDWPMVHDRSTMHFLGAPVGGRTDSDEPVRPALLARGMQMTDCRPKLVHCDLLHHSRRRWKHRLPNCKLQTLEFAVCGRRRNGDIPGRDIPNAYHDYVRSKNTSEMRSVLHHNALDLVTLLQLSCCVIAAIDESGTSLSAG